MMTNPDTVLDAAKLEDLEQRLNEMLAAHQEDAGREREEARGLTQASAGEGVVDRGEASFAESTAELDQALVEHHEHDIRAVRAAIERIHAGQFGLCSRCGNAIGLARLDAWPTAERCVACQAQAESD